MNLKSFDRKREQFDPYGLTCEKWVPRVMPKIDRHNEIELNFVMSGSLTYFFRDRSVTVPAGRIAIFWGLVPHKIISHETDDYYFVCTIPLALFLTWNLSKDMTSKILGGELLVDNSEEAPPYDLHLLTTWERDLLMETNKQAAILEIRARLLRFENNYSAISEKGTPDDPMTSRLARMVFHISRNYADDITAKEIADTVGLSTDYANTLFKKAFGHSMMRQVMVERINHAQCALIFTDEPIFNIAMDCGFNSISCFNSAFRKLNDCSPSYYRNSFRNSVTE